MARKFDIIKKKDLPDEVKIKGFTFLKEPSKKDKKKNKFDFIAHSNENEIGCMFPKRKSWAYTKGYVELDNKKDTFVEVKGRLLIIILLFGLLLGLLFCGLFVPMGETETPPIINVVGDIWDGVLPGNDDKPTDMMTESIEIPGYSLLWVSKEEPDIILVNPTNNTVYFRYTIKYNGEKILETDYLKPNSQISVNLYEKLNTPGTYDLEFIINTYDVETLAACNGAVQDVSLKVY